jgi:hypothetical protein
MKVVKSNDTDVLFTYSQVKWDGNPNDYDFGNPELIMLSLSESDIR